MSTPSQHVLKQLGMVPLTEKRPAELCGKFKDVKTTKENQRKPGLRSRSHLFINPQQHRTAKFERSTLYKAVKAWNLTKPELRLLEDTTRYKNSIQREAVQSISFINDGDPRVTAQAVQSPETHRRYLNKCLLHRHCIFRITNISEPLKLPYPYNHQDVVCSHFI